MPICSNRNIRRSALAKLGHSYNKLRTTIRYQYLPLLCTLALLVSTESAKPDERSGWEAISKRELPLLDQRKTFSPYATLPMFERLDENSNGLASKFMQIKGIPETYKDEDIQRFLGEGIDPRVLFGYLTELGIGIDESQSLAQVGVNLSQSRYGEINRWQWVAMASVIVEGRVKEVKGVVGGPYHTRVTLSISKVLKNCSDFPEETLGDFGLVHAGPYLSEKGKISNAFNTLEPIFRVREPVVIIGGGNPLQLRGEFLNLALPFVDIPDQIESSKLNYLVRRWASIQRNWGEFDDLLERVSRQSSDQLEIYRAYRATWRGLAPKTHDYINHPFSKRLTKGKFRRRVAEIYEAQRDYCHMRSSLTTTTR